MSETPDPIQSLRDALAGNPDNLALHLLLAQTLSEKKRHSEAEAEYLILLKSTPSAKIAQKLAKEFLALDKAGAAVVLLENWCLRPGSSAQLRVTLAESYLLNDEKALAALNFRQAWEDDKSVRSDLLKERLGLEWLPESKPHPKEAIPTARRARTSRTNADAKSRKAEAETDKSKSDIDFSDVGGMETVKDEIRMSIILPIEQPDLFEAYGEKAGGGILLYGPPGCGKTMMAKATAGEASAKFMPIGIQDILDKWFGNSEKKMHAIFESARATPPTVLFFDEIDALAANRTEISNANCRTHVNQFLNELDGIGNANDGLLVLGATNAPWHIDSAFRRPGRFDRILFVPPPDQAARVQILGKLLKGKLATDIDIDLVASKTVHFSGADLKGAVGFATKLLLRQAISTGNPIPLTTEALLQVVKRTHPSTVEWLVAARNFARNSNPGGIYDEILDYPDVSN